MADCIISIFANYSNDFTCYFNNGFFMGIVIIEFLKDERKNYV